MYGNRLINPNALCLFEDNSEILRYTSEDPDRIFNKYRSKNCEEIVEKMLDETNIISSQLVKLWHCYLDLFRIAPRFSVSCLEVDYQAKMKDFWSKLVYVNKEIKQNLFESSTKDLTNAEKNLML